MSTFDNKKNIPAGEIIMKQGDDGNTAYIIETGSVEVLVEKERGLIQSIGTRGQGTIIGEMSLVDQKPRSATIKAIEDCTLLEISREDFYKRLDNADPVIQMVIQVILTRYRDMLTRAHIMGKSQDISAPEDMERGLIEQAKAIENIKLTNELKTAIANKEMVLHYQPILDLNTQETQGFEALVRWQHPEKGLIYPDSFIPIIEENGLITEVTEIVVEEACAALKRIQEEVSPETPYFMSINFSAADFSSPHFKRNVEKQVEKNGLDNEQIHVEITERLLMTHPTDARNTLEECRLSGMVVSIDDFGTGYSSLSYLHYFPIDILKIDRSFIMNMEHDESALELVKSIVALAHNMKMSVIAEGIEEENHIALLQEMKVDKAQGYYFSRPVSEDDLVTYLQK